MNEKLNDTETKNKKTVSVKLDSSTQTEIEQKAKEAGQTVSQYLRKIISDAKTQNKATAPVQAPGSQPLSIVSLDDETLLLVADVVTKAVKGSLPRSINIDFPPPIAPERNYLRKISGMLPEDEYTLSEEEETYLSNLKEAITADVRTTLLLQENSVAFPTEKNSVIQKNMMKAMIEKREITASEKTPTLTKVFQSAIAAAFFEDAERLYNNSLFKATYGFEYKEFKAVFEL